MGRVTAVQSIMRFSKGLAVKWRNCDVPSSGVGLLGKRSPDIIIHTFVLVMYYNQNLLLYVSYCRHSFCTMFIVIYWQVLYSLLWIYGINYYYYYYYYYYYSELRSEAYKELWWTQLHNLSQTKLPPPLKNLLLCGGLCVERLCLIFWWTGKGKRLISLLLN